MWWRVVWTFEPSGDSRVRMYQLKSSQPDNGNYNRVEYDCLRVERVIVYARRSLLAAAMRCRHLHLPALILHRPAARTLLGVHLSIGNHAGHRWSQAGCQQQDQRTELAENTHDQAKTTSLRLSRASLGWDYAERSGAGAPFPAVFVVTLRIIAPST